MTSKKIEDLDLNMKAQAPASTSGSIRWHSYRDAGFAVFGLHWYEQDGKTLRRLPGRAQAMVREPVWSLAQHTSGGRIRFTTNSTSLRVGVTQPLVEMLNMCPIGHSGLDLYVGAPGEMAYWGSSRPDLAAQRSGTRYEYAFFENVPAAPREITLYLPAYNSLTDLEIGLDAAASLTPPTPYAHPRPVVFYGTSITQSGCSSRPANGYVPMLGRMLNTDIVNLGFSGNGLGEPEMAELVSEIDASVFVLDYEANAGLENMEKNLRSFTDILRTKHPQTAILILSKPFFSRVNFQSEGYEGAKKSAAFFRKVASELNAAYPGLALFVDGWTLIGPDDPYAYVDGVHPNDQGFCLMAQRLAPTLRAILPD